MTWASRPAVPSVSHSAVSPLAAGQGDAHAELAYATAEKVCADAAVTKGVDHPAGSGIRPCFRKLAFVPE